MPGRNFPCLSLLSSTIQSISFEIPKKFNAVELNDAMGGGSNQRIYRKTFDWASFFKKLIPKVSRVCSSNGI